MLRSITGKQFIELLAYKRMEPFRELRADYRAASIVQMIANVNRGKKQKAYAIQDFLLKFGEQQAAKKQTWQQQLTLMKLLAAAYAVESVKPEN